MNVYVYPKCTTCQKALAFLAKNSIPFTQIDIKETPPSVKDLQTMLRYVGSIRKLFNTSGILYREMNLSEKLDQMSEKEAFDLLSQNGMLVKRPFVIGKDFGLVGFKEAEWQKVFSKTKS